MPNVVGIKFKEGGKVYHFDSGELQLSLGDFCVVDTARGLEYGEVASAPRVVTDENSRGALKRVVRKATPEDQQKLLTNQRVKQEAYTVAVQKVASRQLPMKIIDVEVAFDGGKMLFFFTAEGRVDFRELVKDLAGVFRTRIELRQIGVRDEAKLIGGLGICGRVLCCNSFLADFAPVSIKMAKEQQLSLNPAKISGLCGRLMCCLRYESNFPEVLEALRVDNRPKCGSCGAGCGEQRGSDS